MGSPWEPSDALGWSLGGQISQLYPAEKAHRDMMYDTQSELYDAVVAAIGLGDGGIFFADGPGGSGKTFVETALLHYVRGHGHVGLACAWSGVAATLLAGGRTCHSTFGFPVPKKQHRVSPPRFLLQVINVFF